MEERILYRCPVCDMPMLEKKEFKIFLLQHYGKQRVKTEIERDLSKPHSEIRIRCGACKKGGYIFAHFSEIAEKGSKEPLYIQAEIVDIFKD